jgi:hypothetical protein
MDKYNKIKTMNIVKLILEEIEGKPEKFFIDKINEMSRLADKSIKRISKLYAHAT